MRLIYMEFDMAKKVIKPADLRGWSLPKSSDIIEKKVEKVSDKIEKIIDELRFRDDDFEHLIKVAAAEAITYALENFAFMTFSKKPSKNIEAAFCLPFGPDDADAAQWRVEIEPELMNYIFFQTRRLNSEGKQNLLSLRKSIYRISAEIESSLIQIEDREEEKYNA